MSVASHAGSVLPGPGPTAVQGAPGLRGEGCLSSAVPVRTAGSSQEVAVFQATVEQVTVAQATVEPPLAVSVDKVAVFQATVEQVTVVQATVEHAARRVGGGG